MRLGLEVAGWTAWTGWLAGWLVAWRECNENEVSKKIKMCCGYPLLVVFIFILLYTPFFFCFYSTGHLPIVFTTYLYIKVLFFSFT